MNSCCNVVVKYGYKCARLKKGNSEFCGYHEKRERLAGARVPDKCNHIYRGARCLIPMYDYDDGLCKKHYDKIHIRIDESPRWFELT